MLNCLLASTSIIYGGKYLDYLFDSLKDLYKDANEIVFIPYARPSGISYDNYTKKVADAFQQIGKQVRGIHTFENPVEAVQNAQGVFTGGGNSFVLVAELYKQKLIEPLRKAIKKSTPYLGTSAGSNIAGPSIQTTNDMPIVYPPSFDTLGVVPFNINPHYLDPDANSKHKGETRETRIKEFHQFNTIPVIGLREGSWIRLQNNQITLQGDEQTARVFEKDKTPYEIEVERSLEYLK